MYLRVQSSGHKSWVLRYSYCGRVRDITLGTWPELTVLQAKQAAHLKREELKLKPSAGLTLHDAYKLWQSKKKGHISSYVEECQRIELHLMPKLGKLQLEEITAPVVLGPNITGIFTTHNHYPYLTGPFSSAGINGVGLAYAETIPVLKIKMDANKGSAIYGKGETVQPSSLVLNHIVKY